MEPDLSSLEWLSLRQLRNGTYVQAVDGTHDHMMNRLKHNHGFVAWSGRRWVLTDKGRNYVDSLLRRR